MPLTHNDIQDLVQGTINTLPPVQFTQLSQKYRDYHIYPTMFKGTGADMDVKTQSGTEIEFQLLIKNSENARNVGLYEPDSTSITDGLKKGKIEWRNTQTSYFFEDHEIEMNSGKHQLLSLIKERREQCMLNLADLLEENFFGCPESSTDKLTPYGLFYWLVKSSQSTSATANCGFFGGAPSGFSDVGGVSPSTVPGWNNYVAPYYSIRPWDNSGTTVQGDFAPKMRRALYYTNWKSPLGGAEMGKTFGLKYKLFTNVETVSQIEEELEAKNDLMFKTDIVPLFGKTTFKGHPFYPIGILDGDTTNPVYGVNTSTFTMYFLQGFKMRESQLKDAPNQHLVSVVFVDNTYNWICNNRRLNFVLSKVSTYAA